MTNPTRDALLRRRLAKDLEREVGWALGKLIDRALLDHPNTDAKALADELVHALTTCDEAGVRAAVYERSVMVSAQTGRHERWFAQ